MILIIGKHAVSQHTPFNGYKGEDIMEAQNSNRRNMTIGKKIGSGFFGVLALLAIIAAISYHSFGAATKGFARYRQIARNTNLMGRIQANLLETRMQAKNYIINGDSQSLSQFNERWQDVKTFTEEALSMINNKERKAILTEVSHEADDYKTHFGAVQNYIAERDTNFSKINDLGPKMEHELSSIMDDTKKKNHIESCFGAAQATRNLLLARIYVMKFMTDNKSEDAKRAFEEIDQMEKTLAQLNQIIDDPAQKSVINQVIDYKKEYSSAFSTIEKTITARNDLIVNQLDVLGPKMAKEVEDVKLTYKAEQDKLGPEVERSNKRATTMVVILGLAAIVLGIVIAFFITRMIVSAITAIVNVVKVAENGDLRQRVTVKSNDELGQMGASFNSLLDVWNNIIRNTIETSNSLSESAEEMSATSDQISQGSTNLARVAQETSSAVEQMSKGIENVLLSIEEQTSSVTETTASVEQMTRNVQEVFRSVESQTSAVNESTSAVEQLLASVKQVAANSMKVNEYSQTVRNKAIEGNQAAKETAQGMQDIANSSQQINTIIGVITGIASQTNLLALNAAIEAARAGDAGKGFAVVADEVRNLAEQSQQAAKEITELIKAANAKAERGVELVEGVNTAINEINSAAQEVNQLAAEVSNATKEQESGVQEIAKAMENLNELTQNVFTAMEEQAQGANEISRAMQSLTSISEQVSTAMTEQAAATEQITNSVAQVSNVAKENEVGANESLKAANGLKDQSQVLQKLVEGLTV